MITCVIRSQVSEIKPRNGLESVKVEQCLSVISDGSIKVYF